MTWTADDLTWLGIEDASSEGNIVTVSIGTPAGKVEIMAEVALSLDGKILVARCPYPQRRGPAHGRRRQPACLGRVRA